MILVIVIILVIRRRRQAKPFVQLVSQKLKYSHLSSTKKSSRAHDRSTAIAFENPMYAGAKTSETVAPIHEEEGMGLYDEPAFNGSQVNKENPLYASNENIADVSNQDDLYNETAGYNDTAAFDMTQSDYNEIDGSADDGHMDVGYLDVDANELVDQPL